METSAEPTGARGVDRPRRDRRVWVIAAVTAGVMFAASVVWAAVPAGLFGYVTLCHDAGTPTQETLILRPDEAAIHLDVHDDPEVRCAAPVPAAAFDPEVDLSGGYHLGDLGGGLYYVTEGAYQMMFLVGKRGVVAVDAPPSLAPFILDAIASVTDLPVTHVVYTHSHADHIAGASIYPDDAKVIAHVETDRQLRSAMADEDRLTPFGVLVGGGPVPLPDQTFRGDRTLRIPGQELRLHYGGPNHEPGNIFVYAPEQKVLMLVDVVFPAWVPFAELAVSEEIPGYYRAYDQALAFDFDTFIGGHLTRVGDRADVEQAREYVFDVRANALTGLFETDFGDIIAETGFENAWLLFDTYLDAVAERCTELTLADWEGVLGGADVFTFGHCLTAAESLRID